MGAAAFASLVTKEAVAYQGNMERAIGSLQEAMQFLRDATSDKGGHREKAMNLIEQAIGETRAGMAYAAEHFGD
ncbi:conserved protein of unknown function [Hyphomicrobium sp. MC1]|nr:conserved protein of unknown function [Hyphomicrobium sp. MC1]